MALHSTSSYLISAVIWLGCLCLGSADEFRQWKSSAGTSVRAKLLSQTKDSILLELESGARKEVKKSLLAPESLKMLESLNDSSVKSASQ